MDDEDAVEPSAARTVSPGRASRQAAAPNAMFDAYAPAEIALRIEASGVAKATAPILSLFTLATLAGAFIAFGAMFFTLVMADLGLDSGSGLGFGLTRTIGGVAFSLGLVLVVVAGAELFTGNNLIVMAWADRRITGRQLLRNWIVVFAGNFFGAACTAVIVDWSGVMAMNGGAMAAAAVSIAEAKAALPTVELIFRGILCNALVCLAVWLSYAAHDVSSKIAAIVFPITAFVALGFEHVIANMYFLPIGMLAGAAVSLADLARNMLWVTLGNLIGGSVLVGLVYWLVYGLWRRRGG